MYLKEKWASNTTRKCNDESNSHQSGASWTRSHLSGVPLLNPDGSSTNGIRDVAQGLRGVHDRIRRLVEHGGIRRTR